MKINFEVKLSHLLRFFFVCLVFAGGFFVHKTFFKSIQVKSAAEHPFLNKTVIYELGKHYIINFSPLKEELLTIQKKFPQKTYVYFLYLNNSGWIGINEREKFTAASLVKVPLAMAIYKLSEEGKLNLEKEYTVQESDLNDGFGSFYKTALGQTFKVEELVKIMLEQSDNTAQDALLNVLQNEGIVNPVGDVYQFFGWQFDFGSEANIKQIDLKTLSNMFLALYNARYLNIENSNTILEYLTNTPFDDKIVAGVPKDIVVSHKIGVAADNKTFSDCGIVYAPNRHYLLCMGSNGSDEELAKKFTSQVSAAVYKYILNH